MRISEAIYMRLPIWGQNMAVHIEGLRIAWKRKQSVSVAYQGILRSRESFGSAQLEEFRRARLRRHLQSAATSSFWAAKFRELGVDPNALDSFAELQKLPILTKDEVKCAGESIHSNLANLGNLQRGTTSGTTGGGLLIVETVDAENERWGVWWRYRGRLGIVPGTRCALFGAKPIVPISQSKPPYWRTNLPGNQLLFSSYHLGERTWKSYVEAIENAGVEWIHGFPSTIALLADYMISSGRRLNTPLKWITTGAENLQQAHRDKISKAFGVQPHQHYGLAESVANISECVCGRMHVDEDFSAVEFLPVDDVPGAFRIIGTNWSNLYMPLLRYDTGDLATLDESPCACGLSWRTVSSLDGRLDDMVTLPSGARAGRLAMIFKDFPEIKEAQIAQKSKGVFVFRIVPGLGYDKLSTESRLLEVARLRLGGDSMISVVYVDQIPRTKGGKLRLVVNEADANPSKEK